ncbi:hypothetical protein ACFQX7_33625 [Luedemannella flava]
MVVIAAIVVAAVVIRGNLNDARRARPGDCLRALDDQSSYNKIVDCADDAAARKVIGVVTNVPFVDPDPNCAQWAPDVTSQFWFPDGSGGLGTELCLGDVR